MTDKEVFITTIELIYSIYRDCQLSFKLTLQDLERQQEIMLKKYKAQGENWSTDDLDKKNFHYAVREEEGGKIRTEAVITQGEWKAKIGEDGSNIRHIGNMCLVMIYQYWEDNYREQIAKSKGITKDELMSDLFGDIRHLRNSIIHNNGQAIDDVNQCKSLKWFRANDEIVIDSKKMDHLIKYIKDDIKAL